MPKFVIFDAENWNSLRPMVEFFFYLCRKLRNSPFVLDEKYARKFSASYQSISRPPIVDNYDSWRRELNFRRQHPNTKFSLQSLYLLCLSTNSSTIDINFCIKHYWRILFYHFHFLPSCKEKRVYTLIFISPNSSIA